MCVWRHWAFALTFAFTSSTVLAQWWNPSDMTPPYLKGTPQAPKVKYDRLTVRAANHAINGFIWNGEFDKLERIYDEFLTQKVRADDGTWMVQAVQTTFDTLFMAMPEDRMAKVMASWERSVPDSRLRPVIEADRWQRLAWNARGGGPQGDVTTEGRQLFRERLAKATKALEASAEVGKDSPIWYWVALIVAGSSGRPAAQFDALFEEAVARFPSYQPLYYTRVNYLLPQWGGDYGKVDAFVKRSVERTSGQEGDAFYAWIYADLAMKVGSNADLFQDSSLSWPHMKKAFDDMARRYPDSRATYLTFACHVRDRDTTARILQEMGNSAETARFGDVTLETCRRFAFSPA